MEIVVESLNQKLFVYLNSFSGHNKMVDVVVVFMAEYMPFVFIAILFYLWFTNRKNEALYAGYATTLGVVLNQIIGLFYYHNRPFMDHLGYTLLAQKAESSFPSDHTTFTLSIALMLLTFKQTRTLGVATVALALICGVSRVYCGVHYPFDILGSTIVSIVAVIAISLLKDKLHGLNIIVISTWKKIFN